MLRQVNLTINHAAMTRNAGWPLLDEASGCIIMTAYPRILGKAVASETRAVMTSLSTCKRCLNMALKSNEADIRLNVVGHIYPGPSLRAVP